MKTKVSPLIAALALALGSGTASAFFLPTGGVDGFGRPIAGAAAEDDAVDFFIDRDQNGSISVGDQIISPLEFTAINDIYAANGVDPQQSLNKSADELVGLSTLTVTSLALVDAADPTKGVSRIDFGSNADGTAMIQLFSLGSSIDLDIGTFANCTNLATCSGAVTDGTPWASFDIIDPDDEWFFLPASGFETISTVPGAVAGLAASTKVGVVNYALSLVPGSDANMTQGPVLDQYIGCASVPDGIFGCAGDGETTILGSTDILGGLGLPAGLGAFARADADGQLNVPEPATLALMGLGLLGIGAARRGKKA